MRGHPQEHLVLVWAGLLQQENRPDGLRPAREFVYWRHKAEDLWTACASAALVSCHAAKDVAVIPERLTTFHQSR